MGLLRGVEGDSILAVAWCSKPESSSSVVVVKEEESLLVASSRATSFLSLEHPAWTD